MKGFLVLAILVVGSALLFLFRHEPEAPVIMSSMPRLVEGRPVGEIVAGFKVEQRMTEKFGAHPKSLPQQAIACVEVMLANYSDRRNSGFFDIGLILDDREFFRQVEASGVIDNAVRRVCFDDVSVRALLDAREVRIMLRCVSSSASAAVTAWTTSDVSAGQLPATSGSAQPRSLVAGLSPEVRGSMLGRHALVLVALGALVIATLFAAGSKPGRAPWERGPKEPAARAATRA